MKQLGLSDSGFTKHPKTTRITVFLAEMDKVVKRQFGFTKVRYRGLAKNTAQLKTLFALTNLSLVRRQLLAVTG